MAGAVAAIVGVTPLGAQIAQGNAKGVVVLRAQPGIAPATPATVATSAVATPSLATPSLANPTLAIPSIATPTASPALVTGAPVPPAPGRPSASFKPCARPFAATAATLGGAGNFDRTVTQALKRRPAGAVIDIATPFSVAGDPPSALSPWLNEVKASGGIVSASEYCRDTRGMFGWIGRMVRAVRGVSYRAADGYDAVLHVDGLDQKVTQVEFKRRAP